MTRTLPLRLLTILTLGAGFALLTASPSLGQDAAAGSDAVDIRGIWREKDLDAKKAIARGLDPKEIETPRKIRHVNPVYPEAAKLLQQVGTVTAECKIDTDGVPQECKVAKKLTQFLDQAALDCITQWRYVPLKLRGQPRPALVNLSVTFTLSTAE